MSLDGIRDDVNEGKITFGPHLVQRMTEKGISIEQVLDVILTGNVRKKESDDRSRGKFRKFTISKGEIVVVVKDCVPGFIITTGRR